MAFTAGIRFGPYEIAARIGAGGMGEVYRATDTALKRPVALKVLPQSVENDPDRLARFQREAELLAALNHPNIAQIYGLERDGVTSALVMELVDGPTLADRIAAGPLAIEETLSIAKQIAEALEAAHDRGIIHRDLKPANIKVRDDGVVKVLDFGLAKAMEQAGSMSPSVTQSPTITTPAQMTGVGVLLGTAAYMSPEQARGRPADKRSDVWAFGAVLYEMLARRRAFPSDELAETLAAVITMAPDWAALPRQTPPSIERLLRRCLEKDPKRRVPDIGMARIELDDALSAPKDSVVSIAKGDARAAAWRRGAVTGIAAATLSATAASLVTVALTRGTATPPVPVTRFTIALPPAQAVALSVNDRDVALSPDGDRLVYTAGSQRQLMVRPFDQLDAVPLAGVTNARAPFFSPDGRWVAFFDRLDEGIATGAVHDGALKKVSIDGGAPSLICQVAGGSRGASWTTPDTIVFATGDRKTGLLRVGSAGGEPEVLTIPDAANGELDHLYPSALPDGRGVLFTITRLRLQDAVALLDPQTRQYKTIVPRGSNAQYVDPGYLVYVVDGTLWGVRFDLRRLEVVGDPVPIVERLMAQSAGNFTLSRKGTLAYMPASGERGARSVIWATRTGLEEPVPMPVRAYWSVRLSPDDSSLVFFAEDFGLWVWDLARSGLTRVAFEPNISNPIWTPDGRSIIYSWGPTEARTIARHAADGRGPTQAVVTGPQNHRPTSITPDGRTLVFEENSRDTGYDLFTVLLDGATAPRSLLQTPSDERNGVISPDGKWIAYESNESGRDQIYVRPFPDVASERHQISTEGGRTPVWARNGIELFFANETTLMSVAIEMSPVFRSGAPQKLFDDPGLLFDTRFGGGNGSTIRAYDVSRDGTRFVIIKQAVDDEASGRRTIVVVQNWLQELKQRAPAR